MTVLYEVNEIRMDDPVSFLKQTVGGKKIFGIIIPCNPLQRSVFSVFGIFAFENRKGDLNIGIVHFIISENKVALQFANPSYTYHIVITGRISVYDVFEYRAEVDAIVGV